MEDTNEIASLYEMAHRKSTPAPGYEVVMATQPESAPLYRLKKDHFLYGRLWPAGSVVRWDGRPSAEMEVVRDVVPSAAHDQSRAGRQKISKDVI